MPVTAAARLFDAPAGAPLPLTGLEVDNLLSFLALLGMLRAIEERESGWRPRVSWAPSPWRASLHVSVEADEHRVAEVVHAGLVSAIDRLARHRPMRDAAPLADVSFERESFRAYAKASRGAQTSERADLPPVDPAQLVACLACEWPVKKIDGAPYAGPLVMMFGQGHQHFLTRYFDVPRGTVDEEDSQGSGVAGAIGHIHHALFRPWTRTHEADGFRWDPEDDQRYALRFGNPSKAGAARTEDGANRLATLGFLSFPTFPASRSTTRGCLRTREGVSFLWPVWRTPLSRTGIEALLSHPALSRGDVSRLRAFGVEEIYRARRVANGKYMNVTRATPFTLE